MRRLVLVVGMLCGLWLAPGALASGWCGSQETATDLPDLVTGRQVHAIVAVPSDAPDSFLTQAGQVADDVTSMVSWWQGQDPTRIPNFDQSVFSGIECLDISFYRLPDTTASLTGSGSAAFGHLVTELESAGFSNQYKKYLIYLPGTVLDVDLCGVGGGDLTSGPGYAFVTPAGCDGVPTDTIATHELLHALGAVPPGDPHCPSDTAHPCDSPTDVLYPYTSGEPLSEKVLDFNHDDYYGHSQTWPDVQDSLWLHRLDEAQVGLSIAFAGGAGSVSPDLPGPACTVACTTQWDPGSVVQLTATPVTTDRFVRWSGSCTGRAKCSVTLAQAASVKATFGPLRIPVRLTVAGHGAVSCSPACTRSFAAGTTLRLRAVAAKGWKFASWSGGCKGTRPTCVPATDYALAVGARFTKLPKQH